MVNAFMCWQDDAPYSTRTERPTPFQTSPHFVPLYLTIYLYPLYYCQGEGNFENKVFNLEETSKRI